MKKHGVRTMARSLKVLCMLMLLTAGTVSASDPINAGSISNFAFRGGYVVFKVLNGSTNYCAPCPADPGFYSSGGYCWVAETAKTQVSMLLIMKAQDLRVTGRVQGISSDCTMYQIAFAD